ncbi:MAG: enoyl-CoA hydratase/isomerase family protein, partial [Actinomycetota bacterium]|nr:enoyl-CoA hydratase/isomerase family protein [Actinomycetota bacterium]
MDAEEHASGKLILDFPAEAVARLRLNNPEKRNPLDHEVLDALAAVLPKLDRGIEVRCVVITGTGKAFSAGYDIGSIPAASFERDAEALVAHPFAAAMEAVSAHPYPVLAAINGHCLGGGLELAVRCDLRVCADGAKLGMPPAKLGLVYGHTGLERFIETVGVPRTKELFLTGRVVDGRRAERIGLVHETCAGADVEA